MIRSPRRARWTSLFALVALLALTPGALPAGAEAEQAVLGAVAGDRDCLRAVDGVDLQTATVADLQAAMAAGTLTSVDLVTAYLARIQAYDRSGPRLNSVRSVNPDALADAAALDAERARTGPRGPLHGIPILLKDNVGTNDLPTTAGSIALATNIPTRDATVTAKLRAAGAVILGKANLSEFANWMATGMPNGYSSLGGQVIAPYDAKLDASGSSTGSGVSGTMALAATTIGTETSGSIISPSTRHSLVGVKPTLGLVSRAGVIPLAPTYDTAGPMTRTVTDAAATLGAIAGSDPRDAATARAQLPAGGDYLRGLRPDALQGVRLGVRATHLGSTNATGQLFNAAVTVLRAAGATIVEIPDAVGTASTGGTALVSYALDNDFKMSLNAYLATEASGTPMRTLADIIAFNKQHPDKVKYGQDHLEDAEATSGSPTDPQFLASATVTTNASKRWIDGVLTAYDLDAIVGPDGANTGVTAAAGYPNVTVPMGYTGTTPRGLAFAAGAYDEPQLLAYAYAYEQRSAKRVPPTVLNPALTAELGCG